MNKIDIVNEIILTEEELSNIRSRLREEICSYYKSLGIQEIEVVVIMKGAVYFATDLLGRETIGIKEAGIKINLNFIIAKSYEGTNSTGKVETELGLLPTRIDGKHLLVIDDIYDTGRTLICIKEELEKYNPASIEFCVLLERHHEVEKELSAKFVGYHLETDAFLVGYGLDYNENYRYLQYIATANIDPETGEIFKPVSCNYCGGVCTVNLDKRGPKENYGLIDAQVMGGYYSTGLEDESIYTFSICEKCLVKIFKKFKIAVRKQQYNAMTGEIIQ